MRPGAGSGSTRVDLDDAASYTHLDPRGMLGLAVDFPKQLEDALAIGEAFQHTDGLPRDPAQIVLAGMGGSAVIGDLLAGLCAPHLKVPFLVNRDYRIPAFVGPDTLFIASSHSGDTEETLAATTLALRRKARIVGITTGGKLASRARRKNLPLIAIPKGDPPMPPRASLGYSLIPLVCLLEKLGLYPQGRRDVREAIALLGGLHSQVRPGVPTSENPAKELALDLVGTIPWVHGTAGIMSAASYRWRCQFNENSKALAYSAEYPELNHNEIVGWELGPKRAGNVAPIILYEPDLGVRMQARVDFTNALMGAKGSVHLIEARGRSALARLLWVVHLADFVSIYLAYLNGVDPADIGPITELKRLLTQL